MIIVHHLENSRSQRVLWLLEELGLEYEVKRYARNPQTMLAPPELRAVHPLGKSPVIEDDGRVVAESGAIIEYLVRKYDKGHQLHPVAGSDNELDYTYWLHYAEGSLMPLLVMKLIFSRLPIEGAAKNFVDPNLDTHLAYVAGRLGEKTGFAGESLSAADIQMSFPLEAAAARANLADKHPNLLAFLQRAQARPAYQRALKRGGPYELLK
ncbi:MAG TPA: glutathione S-transferase [Dongiaceae bacterium]|nr:glutathione S-transferase [Dongiaceae bacterium]